MNVRVALTYLLAGVLKFGSLDLLDPSGPVESCTEIAVPDRACLYNYVCALETSIMRLAKLDTDCSATENVTL
jgi:hypothetical protein